MKSKNIWALLLVLRYVLFAASGYASTPQQYDLQMNLGPLPINSYFERNGTQIPNCDSADWTVQRCIRKAIADYAAQRVTGIRFQLPLMSDPAYSDVPPERSAPMDLMGGINFAYFDRLQAFFQDLHDVGILNVTLTPNLENWGHPGWDYNTTDDSDPSEIWNPDLTGDGRRLMSGDLKDPCANNALTPMRFTPTFPIGFPLTKAPDDQRPGKSTWLPGGLYPQGLVNGYKCSPTNPIFVGWDKIYGALDLVLQNAQSAGLTIFEWDVENEVNLADFNVTARLISDNTHGGENVYLHFRDMMAAHGFDPGRVTFSTVARSPSVPAFDCSTGFGDSARLLNLSVLYEAFRSDDFISVFEGWVAQKNLPCSKSNKSPLQFGSARSFPLPDLVDVHYSPCAEINGHCDAGQQGGSQADATQVFNDINDFMNHWLGGQGTFLLGETNLYGTVDGAASCDDVVPNSQAAVEAGFNQSHLNGSKPSVLRPWASLISSCEPFPETVNPPFQPQGQSKGDVVFPWTYDDGPAHGPGRRPLRGRGGRPGNGRTPNLRESVQKAR